MTFGFKGEKHIFSSLMFFFCCIFVARQSTEDNRFCPWDQMRSYSLCPWCQGIEIIFLLLSHRRVNPRGRQTPYRQKSDLWKKTVGLRWTEEAESFPFRLDRTAELQIIFRVIQSNRKLASFGSWSKKTKTIHCIHKLSWFYLILGSKRYLIEIPCIFIKINHSNSKFICRYEKILASYLKKTRFAMAR